MSEEAVSALLIMSDASRGGGRSNCCGRRGRRRLFRLGTRADRQGSKSSGKREGSDNGCNGDLPSGEVPAAARDPDPPAKHSCTFPEAGKLLGDDRVGQHEVTEIIR